MTRLRQEATTRRPLHSALLRVKAQHSLDWLVFREPQSIVTASRPQEVLPALQQIETLTARGAYALGFVAYEAAAALDSAFQACAPRPGLPLLWFGLYPKPERVSSASFSLGSYRLDGWKPSVSLDEYRASISSIKRAIERGDTYQVNYTLRLRSHFRGDSLTLFLALRELQDSPYACYLDIGRFQICSVSPELFFARSNALLICKPMKGTAQRGRTQADDEIEKQQLRSSIKNRSENVMIVDMVRSDVGRIAVAGSVHVDELFAVETFPTLLQMTSTVSARVDTSIAEVFRALFPCASVTGAPRIKTMEMIRQLEREPRGIYTGAIGYLAPNGDSQFSVAIRTVVTDAADQIAEYGTGSGIVWDSNADEEYAECQLKAQVLSGAMPPQSLDSLNMSLPAWCRSPG